MKMHLDRSNNHHRPSTLPQGLTCVRPPSSASSQHPITDPRPNLLHKVRQCVAFPLSCWATRKPPPPPSISTNPSITFNIVGKMPPESLFARADEFTRPSPMDWLPRSSMRAGALPSCPASWGEHRSRCNNLRMDVWLTAYSISHLRYPTAGTSSASEAQPFYVNSPFGLSMSINGNITNPQEVARFLDQEARRHVNTASDSELVLNVFANALNELGKARANVDDIFTALRDVYKRCIGAYSCVAMVAGFGLLAFRDSNGIRPLCLGSRPSATIEGAKDYFLASESIALTQLGFTDVVNIKPGEAVFIQKGGVPQFKQIEKRDSWSLDIFEMVYFARPDSELDGISVHRSRENMGRKLAKKIKDTLSKEAFDEIDVVIPVPETSNTSASILAQEMGKPFSNAFVKNRYIFRTFIPGQKARRAGIRRKLSCIKSEFKDRVVLLTDDSIVRGNTSREIVQMAKEAGAKKVLFVSCSPEIRYPHVHGIDLADRDELIAYGKTAEEVATAIGASEVVYQSLDDLKDACREAIQDGYEKIDFETGVFSGQYTTPVPEEYFEHLERLRSNKKRKAAAITESEGGAQTVLVASGGPVNVSSRNHIQDEDVKGPENREDVSIYNFAGKA